MSKLGRLVPRGPALALGLLALVIFAGPSAKTNKRAGLIRPDAGSLMAVYGADAVTVDRNARDFKLPDQIEWKDRPGSASQTAILFGDSSYSPVSAIERRRDICLGWRYR